MAKLEIDIILKYTIWYRLMKIALKLNMLSIALWLFKKPQVKIKANK